MRTITQFTQNENRQPSFAFKRTTAIEIFLYDTNRFQVFDFEYNITDQDFSLYIIRLRWNENQEFENARKNVMRVVRVTTVLMRNPDGKTASEAYT